MEDTFKNSEHGSTFGEEASTEDDSRDTSSAPDETEMVEDSLDERATAVGEGHYEHTSNLLPLRFVLHLYIFLVFFFPCLIFSIFQDKLFK